MMIVLARARSLTLIGHGVVDPVEGFWLGKRE